MQILHIDSSVTGPKSVSRPLTGRAAEHFRALLPNANYVYRDLVAAPLPHYTALKKPEAGEAPLSGQEQAKFELGEETLAEFLASDLLILGVPMYNFSIPSQLKAWIDLICVPGKTFRYGANGPEGLCSDKRVVVISTRGGLYGPGTPFAPYDHQAKLVEQVMHFVGITEVQTITAEGVALNEVAAERAKSEAVTQIGNLTLSDPRLP